MKRVLVVNVNWLGDSILALPIFRALKEKYSYVAVMVPSRIADLFRNNIYIDEVIIFDERNEHRSFILKLKFIRYLRSKNFDIVFLLHRSFTKALICFLAGIKERVGYRRLKNFFVLTKRIKPKDPLTIHRQDYYFYLFEKYGVSIKDKALYFFVDENIKSNMKSLIDNHKYSYLVGINASSNWNLKRWPEENFAKLADLLIERLDCAIVFIGKDLDIVENVIRKIKNTNRIYNFCGKTNLNELAALLDLVDLFISADSGPAHLASALNKKTLVLFGPTKESITSPRGNFVYIIRKKIDCKIPCYNLSCRDNICMKKIDVGEVFLKAYQLLKNG